MSAPLNILLVDDRPENLLAMQAVLEPLGQNLVIANSGADALRQVLEHDFAAILLDVEMPGMNGFETARIIRQRERSRHTPIIFVTATLEMLESAAQGYDAGAVDYLIKPVAPETLRAKVKVFLDLATVRRELETEIAAHERAERDILRFNEDLEQRVRERTAELEAANERLRQREAEILALNANLERRVEERTASLREAHELLQRRAAELEAFNRVMVGREQRIIEMKKEVNARCAELGRAPPYPPVWEKGPG